jgi:hypothetical protein
MAADGRRSTAAAAAGEREGCSLCGARSVRRSTWRKTLVRLASRAAAAARLPGGSLLRECASGWLPSLQIIQE